MINLYPKLIESALEFRVYSKQKLAENSNQEFVLTCDLETVPLAKGYDIKKIEDGIYTVFKLNDEKSVSSNTSSEAKEEEVKHAQEPNFETDSDHD